MNFYLTENEIREQLVKMGGCSMGAIYDEWVMKPGELPVEQQLAKVGLEIAVPENGDKRTLRKMSDITPAQRRILEGWLKAKAADPVLK